MTTTAPSGGILTNHLAARRRFGAPRLARRTKGSIMFTPALEGPLVRRVAAVLALLLASQAAWLSAQQPAQPAQPTAGSDAAAREAVLKALTVETLIGDAVSLSNQKYPEVESAIQRFVNSDLKGARDYLDLAKTKYPKLPPTDLTLAKMFVILRSGQQARVFLEEATTKSPTDPEAYLLLADLGFIEGRITEAHALFEKADGLTQKFTENEKRQKNFAIRVLAGLSAINERRQQWDQAQALLQKWVGIDPDSAIAHQRLGATLYRLGKIAEAQAEFTKARELDPNSNHPQIWLGLLYTQDKKNDEARKAFEAAYAAEPDNERTAQAFAEWLIQQNDLDKAKAVASALRKKAPASLSALLLDGIIDKMQGKNDTAEATLMQVLASEPNNSTATNMLALLLSESKDPADLDKALGYAQRNAAMVQNNTQINITYAWVLYQMGRLAEANQILSRGINNPSADGAYLIARIMEAQNQPEKAAALLQEVMAQAAAGGVFLYRRDAEAMLQRLLASGVKVPEGVLAPPSGAAAPTTGAAPTGASPTGAAPTGAAPTGVGAPAGTP
jgi:tetratricopeptide (TPR) repeat protein